MALQMPSPEIRTAFGSYKCFTTSKQGSTILCHQTSIILNWKSGLQGRVGPVFVQRICCASKAIVRSNYFLLNPQFAIYTATICFIVVQCGSRRRPRGCCAASCRQCALLAVCYGRASGRPRSYTPPATKSRLSSLIWMACCAPARTCRASRSYIHCLCIACAPASGKL